MNYHVISDRSGAVIHTTSDLEEAREYAKKHPYDAYVYEDIYLWA